LAKRSGIIILVVTDSNAVGELLFEQNGIGRAASKGAIVVHMRTFDPRVSRKYAKRLERRGIEYFGAPMSGGVLGARNAQLLFMVGVKRDVYERCLRLFEAIGKRAIYMGKTGSRDLIKLVHNETAVSVFVATWEAVLLGEELRLSREDMIEVFKQGNACSFGSEVRFPKFIIPKADDMGTTFASAYKDISIVRRMSKMAKLRLPSGLTTVSNMRWKQDTVKKTSPRLFRE
jgi:3-hydroxyisobutyrate dehydrogenase-like beta-hydroxyacid dehydrogenase